jgi:Domain of unknown function (DUF932)
MSIHTKEYLHSNIAVGGATGIEDGLGWRDPAWWFNAAMEAQRIANGERPSHYSGYIPLSVIRSDIFGWSVLDGVMSVTVDLHIPGDHPLSKTPGTEERRQVTFNVPEWKGVIREDKLIECYLNDKLDELAADTCMNIASKSFPTDNLAKVLLDNTIEVVGGGDNMGITGAGVLKWGKVGYLEVSIPETLHDPHTGIKFRPNMLGSTSFDGSVATRWDRTITNVVCDNTHQWALQQSGDATGSFKIKRTKNFAARLPEARKCLGLMEQGADEFTKILAEWSRVDVSPKQFIKWLDVIVPVPDVKMVEKSRIVSIQGEKDKVEKYNAVITNSQNIALNKRDDLSKMYFEDPRVSPWAGTKLGVGLLVNTWARYDQKMKGEKLHDGNVLQARVEGQLLKVLDNSFQKQDVEFLDALDEVLKNYDPEGVMIPVGSGKAQNN